MVLSVAEACLVTPDPGGAAPLQRAVRGDEMSDVRDREDSRDDDGLVPFAVYADPPTLLHLSGELDADSASMLASALDPLISRGGAVGLDLAALTFMDSTGIKVLCEATQRLGDRGRIVLFNPPPMVLRVLEIAGLGGVFEIGDEARRSPT